MGAASMSRTFRILVAKTILAFTSTTAGAAVVSQSKTTVVASSVKRPLLAQTKAEALQGALTPEPVMDASKIKL
jgi:hypothetical protein